MIEKARLVESFGHPINVARELQKKSKECADSAEFLYSQLRHAVNVIESLSSENEILNAAIGQLGAIECHRDMLEHELEQVTRERDAAVSDARGVCRACIHYNGHYPTGNIMSCCKFEECVHGADDWESEDHWQWRGVEVE